MHDRIESQVTMLQTNGEMIAPYKGKTLSEEQNKVFQKIDLYRRRIMPS
jgi:hypothetical protein